MVKSFFWVSLSNGANKFFNRHIVCKILIKIENVIIIIGNIYFA